MTGTAYVAGRGGIAGAVGEEETVGLVRHHLVEAGRGGQHGHPRAGVGEVAEDVALGAIIDGDDVGELLVMLAFLIALAQPPFAAGPAVHLPAGDLFREVHALEPGPGPRLLQQGGNVERPVLSIGDHPVRRAVVADLAGQRAGVDARQADPAVRPHPFDEALRRPEIARRGDVLAHHAAQRERIVRLQILIIRADIADMRER